jgi:hypothetical protein
MSNILFGRTWERFENIAKCKELEVEDKTKSKLDEDYVLVVVTINVKNLLTP